MSLFAELKRRNVFRVGAAYLVAAWLLLQLTEVLTELLELSTDIGKTVIVLLLVGFVLALFLAWAFELTPDGVKRESEVDRSQSIRPQTGRKLDRAIIGLLVLALAYFVWEARFMHRSEAPPASVSTPVTPPIQATVNAVREPAAPAGAAEPLQLNDGNSIAVLPFANRSVREEDSFFAEGMHDDLLTQLAKINRLKVVSRTSVMRYRDTDKSIPEIADELGVTTILEGGVQRAGDRVRINMQLIDVNRDEHLWAETFDREMTVENVFDIQSEITREIVQAVRGEITPEEIDRLGKLPTTSLAAYDAYLQARSLARNTDYNTENYLAAQRLAEEAVRADPNFMQAWALLVEIHGQLAWLGYDTSQARFDQAFAALGEAKRIAPESPEVTAAEAEYVYRVQNDFAKAAELFSDAYQEFPGSSDILGRLALAQRRTPQVEAALENFTAVMTMDPNDSRTAISQLETLVFSGELDRALVLSEVYRARFPERNDIIVFTIELLARMGRFDQAAELHQGLSATSTPSNYTILTEFPFWMRDLDGAIEIWSNPIIAAATTLRGFAGQRDLKLGHAHQLLGNHELAAMHLQKAIESINQLPVLDYNAVAFEQSDLAIAHALLGQNELAMAAVDKGADMMPESRDTLFGQLLAQQRALTLGLVGRREEALAEIERMLNTPYKVSKWLLYKDIRWDFFRDDERFNDLVRPDGVLELQP